MKEGLHILCGTRVSKKHAIFVKEFFVEFKTVTQQLYKITFSFQWTTGARHVNFVWGQTTNIPIKCVKYFLC